MAKHKTKQRKAKALANQANSQVAHAEKSYTGGSFYYGESSREYRADEWGVAQAYTLNMAVSRGVKFWEDWLNGLKWEIRDSSTEKVLINSDKMRRLPEGQGSRFAKAVKLHKRYYKHSYFASLAFSDVLYGESYTRFVANDWGMAQLLEWLNPLAVEPDIIQGRITSYRYAGSEKYETLQPNQVAYRIAKRDSQNDLRGLSRVLAIIDTLNIESSEKKSLKNYYKNNMQLGGVISPTNPEISLAPNQVMQFEDSLAQNNKGAVNAGRWVIAPANMNITPFPAVDMEKNAAVLEPMRDEILMALEVYPQLVGDPSKADYDSAYDIKRQWWELLGIPYAHDIEDYINDQVLPVLEPHSDCYFAFVLTPYEVEKPEVVAQDFSAGFIDMDRAMTLRGYEGDADLKGIFMVNNMPMSKAILLKIANTPPSQYQLDMAQADKADAEAQATISTPTPPALSSGVVPATEAAAIMGVNTLTDSKKSVGELPTLADGTPIIEAPFPAALGSIHDGIPDDIHISHGLGHSHDTLPTIIDFPPDADPLQELYAWSKFVRSGKAQKRQFTPICLRGDFADTLQAAIDSGEKQVILDAFKAVETRLSVKAIQATRLSFESDFDELLKRARAEKMGRVQWASSMRSILRRFGTRAYIDGMIDGGVEDEPSEDDRIAINELVAGQSQYVTELGNVLYKGDGISDATADIRAAMWYNKGIDPLYQAGLLSADANGLYEWAYGKTELHCTSCKRLNGQRHRLKGWKANIMPKSEELECGGWLCDCNLVKVKGRQRGNY